MEKRLITAVVLSMVVLLLYPAIVAKFNPSIATSDKGMLSQLPENRDVIDKPTMIDSVIQEEAATASAASNIFNFNNDRYVINISDLGGGIRDIEIQDGIRPDTRLVENALYGSSILSMEGKGALQGISSQLFDIEEAAKKISTDINGLTVKKSFVFLKDKYAISASINIKNNSDTKKFYAFSLVTASNISNKDKFESRYLEADVLYSDGRFKKIGGPNFKDSNMLEQNNITWIALKNKYYSIIAAPDFDVKSVFTRSKNKLPVIGLNVEDETLLPGEKKTYNVLFYIGPTDIEELEKVDSSFGKALNFGIFTSIGLVLLSVLKFFYGIFNNYGIAILLLTFCVSMLLFPLSFKSMQSMKNMQALQPQMEKLRKDYKDNPQKLNKEMMELYRRHKVNPMGGCFPMLLQMPIFISLYQTLMRSVELKGASFLWIKDLSMPDRAFTLPTTLPFLGDAINLLPILMIGAMIIQQKLSQGKAAQTEQQKMMTSIMPVMFGFIFYSLPSGLVLYWLTNTLITSSMQYMLLRKS
ncbi:MAG: membrane protein insertase YidC [Candidatus Omnitrophota bacterium]